MLRGRVVIKQSCSMRQPPAHFRGIIPAIASPCDANEDFDEECFSRPDSV